MSDESLLGEEHHTPFTSSGAGGAVPAEQRRGGSEARQAVRDRPGSNP